MTTTPYEGYVDGFRDNTLFGWCYRRDQPDVPLTLDIHIDGGFVGTVNAALFREDLLKAGKGNGKHSFRFPLPDRLARSDTAHAVNVTVAENGFELTSSPVLLKNGAPVLAKCYFPWTNLSVNAYGEVNTCSCPSWLGSTKFSIGNINERAYDEIWNGPRMRRYREAFLNDDHKKFCRVHICPYLTGTIRQAAPGTEVLMAMTRQDLELDFGPSQLIYDINDGCNLRCIMCRNEVRPVDKEIVHKAVENIKTIASQGSLKSITTSGSGEIFMFEEFVDLMRSDFLSSRGIALNLISNLTLFTPKLWDEIKHNYINSLSVSVDAATKETYESVRRGSKWENIHKKLLYVSELAKNGEIAKVSSGYVVTTKNAHEVDKMIQFITGLGFNLFFLSHRGRLPTKMDNIFETCNIGMLDMVYDRIERCGGFDTSLVNFGSCGILRDRAYREAGYRLEMAQYQMTQYGDVDMAKQIARGCLQDIEAGMIRSDEAQLTECRRFIEMESPTPATAT